MKNANETGNGHNEATCCTKASELIQTMKETFLSFDWDMDLRIQHASGGSSGNCDGSCPIEDSVPKEEGSGENGGTPRGSRKKSLSSGSGGNASGDHCWQTRKHCKVSLFGLAVGGAVIVTAMLAGCVMGHG